MKGGCLVRACSSILHSMGLLYRICATCSEAKVESRQYREVEALPVTHGPMVLCMHWVYTHGIGQPGTYDLIWTKLLNKQDIASKEQGKNCLPHYYLLYASFMLVVQLIKVAIIHYLTVFKPGYKCCC